MKNYIFPCVTEKKSIFKKISTLELLFPFPILLQNPWMLLETDDEIYLKRTTIKPEENTKKSNKKSNRRNS